MNSSTRTAFFWLPVMCMAALAAKADVGAIPASHTVDRLGGFNYTIPIWLPPGPKDVEPHLALVYDSTEDDTAADNMPLAGTSSLDAIPAGAGWVLTGLSMIERVNTTMADDGQAAAPAYAANDAYALDGNRLRLTSIGNYGQDGATYQTQMANFSLITSHGSTGYGPDHWTVQGKDGLTYEYGNTTDSKVQVPGGATGQIRVWLLDKVSDTYGNTYTVTYGTGASGTVGTAVPTSISWTPSSAGSSTYNYTVSFTYQARTSGGTNGEAITGYVAGAALENNNLLKSITVTYGSTQVERYYSLSYISSQVTSRNLLSSIEECTDSSMSDCLTPTGFAYVQGASGVAGSSGTALTGATSVVGAYDFNGDGRSDILYVSGGTLWVALSNGSGFTQVSTGIAAGKYIAGHWRSRTQDDLLVTQNGTWYLYTWNAASGNFGSPISTGIAAPPTGVPAYAALADVNGDGLPDLVTVVGQSVNGSTQIFTGLVSTWLNTSANGSFSLASSGTYTLPACSSGVMACVPELIGQADINGDGRTDLLTEVIAVEPPTGTQNTTTYTLLSNGSGSNWSLSWSGAFSVGSQDIHWNSDRCDDFVAPGDYALLVSACNGKPATALAFSSSSTVTAAGVIDWNGDGLDDLLINDNGVLGIETSSGSGINPLVTTGISLPSSATVLSLDVNGDGLPDIAIVNGGTVTYYLHNAIGQRGDLLSSITDGNGNTLSPVYTSISDGAYTAGTGASDPESDWIGNLWVVQQLTVSDGTGGKYTESYHYTDARMNRLRGFEGFSEIQVTDGRNSESRYTCYDLLFPKTGMVNEEDLFQGSGTPQCGGAQLSGTAISTATYANTDDQLDTRTYFDRHFPYAQKVTQDTYEVGGTENGQKITESVTNYDFKSPPDNYGNFTSVDTTVTDKDPGSPYVGEVWETTTTASYVDDASTWCLTLPQSIAIAQSAPGESTITHTTTYNRDSSYCRALSLTEDAGMSAYDVTRQFGYDGFGNVKQVTVSGSGFPDRISTYNWGTTGQFVEQIQDPVAYASNYEEKIGYDYGKGVKTSDVIQTTSGTQDAPPTRWTPDGFGRITQEAFPDSTTLNITYTACSQTSCNGYPNAFEVVAATAKGSDSSTISAQNTYVDSFGRTVARTQLLLDGSSALTEQSYDQYGNLVAQTTPCNASPCPAYTTSIRYDALNRPTSISSPDPSVVTPTGNVTTTISYTGRKTSVQNAKGQVTTRIVDVTGALRQTLDDTGYGQAFTLDSDGNVRQANGNGTSTAFLYSKTYDYGGEGDYTATMSDRALGSWSYSPDALGDLVSYTDAKGQQFKNFYDGLGRITEREDWTNDSSGISCGQGLTCETDTTWQWGVTPGNHDAGQLDQTKTTTSAGVYVDQSQYDADARLSHRLITIPGDATYQYSLSYNAQGLLSNLQYPAAGSQAGLSLNYSYQNGVLSSVKDATSGTAYWQATAVAGANEVNGLGQLATDTLGNGIVTERWYTAAGGWLSKIISGPTAGSATVQNQTYSYDVVGNVTQRQDNNGQGLTENFPAYDGDNRLKQSTLLNSSTNTSTTNLSVSYNDDGSLSQKTEVGGTDTPVGYTVHWTSYNYPQSISGTVPSGQNQSATFDYGGADRQRWRMVYTEGSASETTEYIGKLMEKVTSSSGPTDYRYYVYGGTGLAALVDVNGSTTTSHYVLEDHEGSISGLLTSSGSIAVGESFTAFGNRREASTWSGPPNATEAAIADSITRQGFTGQTVLGQLGLNHMNGRVEDAVSGTFLSPDPYVTDPENTQDYYRYAYVYNRPLSYLDPTGFGTVPDCEDIYVAATTAQDQGGGGNSQANANSYLPPVTIPASQLPLFTVCTSGDGGYMPPQGGMTPPPSGNVTGSGGSKEPQKQQGHEYQVRDRLCRRPLTEQEKRDLISRFTVPNIYTQGRPQSAGTHLVANSWGIPGGWVNTRFSPDGVLGTNTTTPFHVFTGTVERSISNTDSGAYMLTHGYGGYPSVSATESPYASLETGVVVDLGGLLDLINDEVGPSIFKNVDEAAAKYAKTHFPGC